MLGLLWNCWAMREIGGAAEAECSYAYQEGEGGIADALRLAEDFADGGKIAVVLGDNIIEGTIASSVESFRKQEKGARILLKEVHDPMRFGVATLEKSGGEGG